MKKTAGKRRAYRPVKGKKNPTTVRKKVNSIKLVKEPTLKNNWNKGLTAKQNVTKMCIGDFEAKLADTYVPTVKRISAENIATMRRLVAKHGEDTLAMARDIKLNQWQWTAQRCGRLLQQYRELQLDPQREKTEEKGEEEGRVEQQQQRGADDKQEHPQKKKMRSKKP
eukprot:GHVU01192865.1.p2 GENE.GHVU01192865.1~~GHVU01192865.1.p2  ORF type:complete len:168 (-),score=43.04 GHVU01192865.1:235-738(-)